MKHSQVLVLTSDGTPFSWTNWQEAVTIQYKGLVAWSPATDEAQYFGGHSRLTGKRSHIEVPSIIAIKGNFKRNNSTPILTNQNLAFRDKFICGYCTKRITKEGDLTRDHIVPKSKGGLNVWENVILSCRHCNNKKDNKTPEQAGMELIWIPYRPSRHEVLLTQNRKILYDQVDYISKFVDEKSRILQYVKETWC